MNLDVTGALTSLADRRPIFHSERDFQHALGWQLQLTYPAAQIRMETRPRRGVHLDLLVRLGDERTAIELKYLVAALHATVGGESFDLPHQSANDISRHDVVRDIARVEAALSDGYADSGCVVVLTNDRSYWQASGRTDTIDADFRVHEGRVLEGTLHWSERAGKGTTAKRDLPLRIVGRYGCHWHDYSQIDLVNGRAAQFRYLMLVSGPSRPAPIDGSSTTAARGPVPATAVPQPQVSPRISGQPGHGAREEILAAARRLADRSPDGCFTVLEVVKMMQRDGTRYATSTIKTQLTSRLCADAPDNHGTTYDDFERVGPGRYRFRR